MDDRDFVVNTIMADYERRVQNSHGHEWKRDDGMLDIFGYEAEPYHNGPVCVKCGYGYCWHCKREADQECPK